MKEKIILGYGFDVCEVGNDSVVKLVKRVEPEVFAKEVEFYRKKNPDDDMSEIEDCAAMDVMLFSSGIPAAKGNITGYVQAVANNSEELSGHGIHLEREGDILFVPDLRYMSEPMDVDTKNACEKYLSLVCAALPECAKSILECFGPIGGTVYVRVLRNE